MRLITILYRTLKLKSFVFKKSKFGKIRKGQPTIEIEVIPRKGSKAICSGFEKPRPGYDTLTVRHFEHIPFWGFLVFFIYGRRRVNCPKYGVVAEKIPLADGKEHMTKSYQCFLAHWAKRLRWQEVARCFKASWHHVFNVLIMNWFKAKKNISPGIVEGLNSRVRLTFKKAFGFRTFEATEIELYQTFGDLPEPKTTHTFFEEPKF